MPPPSHLPEVQLLGPCRLWLVDEIEVHLGDIVRLHSLAISLDPTYHRTDLVIRVLTHHILTLGSIDLSVNDDVNHMDSLGAKLAGERLCFSEE